MKLMEVIGGFCLMAEHKEFKRRKLRAMELD